MPDLSTTFVVAGSKIDFPEPAAGAAVKSAAKRFESAWGLPADAAFALAATIVDPAKARQAIDPTDPFEHLQRIQTPDGKVLLALRTTVWTALVSGDGGNRRSRYTIQTAGANGGRSRPWPIGRHHKPAIIDYHPAALEDMTAAVQAERRGHPLPGPITQIARNPRGIWKTPCNCHGTRLRHARRRLRRGALVYAHDRGQTRAEACHELSGTDPAAPLMKSDKPLEHLRESHARLVERSRPPQRRRRPSGHLALRRCRP